MTRVSSVIHKEPLLSTPVYANEVTPNGAGHQEDQMIRAWELSTSPEDI